MHGDPLVRFAEEHLTPLIDPIVPAARTQPFDDSAYLFEPKYDGFRGLL